MLMNQRDKVTSVRSSMERQDVTTSRVKEKCHFDPSIGSSLGGCDQSEGPPIVITHDRYNSLDGRLQLISI